MEKYSLRTDHDRQINFPSEVFRSVADCDRHERRGWIHDSLFRLTNDPYLQGSVNFKFGVLYAKEGQTTDDEMFSNGKYCHYSP